MAWTKVSYDRNRQDQVQVTYSAPQSGSGGGGQTSTTYQVIRTYVAVSDTDYPSMLSALTASDGVTTVPTAGVVYTVDGIAGFTCTQVLPKMIAPKAVELQATFERKINSQPAGNPEKWNVTIDMSGQKFTQTAYKSAGDDPQKDIVNSANEPFDPALTRTFYDEKIEIAYQTTVEDSAAVTMLRGKVNNGTVTFNIAGVTRSFDQRQLLCEEASFSASAPLDGGDPTWKVKITLIARQDKYETKVLDQGWHYLQGLFPAKLVKFKDKDGLDVSAPQRLDGSGNPLAEDADPVYLTFKIEEEADLSPLFEGLS